MDLAEIKYVVAVTANSVSGCQECSEWRAGDASADTVAEAANHYVAAHGYRILHVGQETTRDVEGRPWQYTVIVVGTDDATAAERYKAKIAKAMESVRISFGNPAD